MTLRSAPTMRVRPSPTRTILLLWQAAYGGCVLLKRNVRPIGVEIITAENLAAIQLAETMSCNRIVPRAVACSV